MSVYFEPVVDLDDGPIPIVDPTADDFHLSGYLDITNTRTRAVLALVHDNARRVRWVADDTPLHSMLGREWDRRLGLGYLDKSTIPEHIPDTTLDFAIVTNLDKAEYYTSTRWGHTCPLPVLTASHSSPLLPTGWDRLAGRWHGDLITASATITDRTLTELLPLSRNPDPDIQIW